MSNTRVTLNRLLYFFLAGGFALLFAETAVHHQEVIHETRIPWIPIIFSALGFLLCLIIGAVWRPAWIRLGQVVMVLALAVGLAGVFFHNEGRVGAQGLAPLQGGAEAENHGMVTGMGEAHEHEHAGEGEGASWFESLHMGPPPLAPLAFAGMGILGLLAGARRWPGETPPGNDR